MDGPGTVTVIINMNGKLGVLVGEITDMHVEFDLAGVVGDVSNVNNPEFIASAKQRFNQILSFRYRGPGMVWTEVPAIQPFKPSEAKY